MEWEAPPDIKVDVPVVRNWLTPAVAAWVRLCYGGRGIFFWSILLLPLWVMWQMVKVVLYGMGVAGLLAVFLLWAVAECITYKHRKKREQLRAWQQYMADLHEVDPPQAA
jgi:hypothetical protein